MPQEILAVIGTFLCLIILGTTFLRNRHRERLALIQYGKDHTTFKKPSRNSSLKFGLLLISVGAGILVGGMFDSIFNSEPACSFACIFLFGGMSLVYYHHIYGEARKEDNSSSRNYKNFMEDDDEIV